MLTGHLVETGQLVPSSHAPNLPACVPGPACTPGAQPSGSIRAGGAAAARKSGEPLGMQVRRLWHAHVLTWLSRHALHGLSTALHAVQAAALSAAAQARAKQPQEAAAAAAAEEVADGDRPGDHPGVAEEGSPAAAAAAAEAAPAQGDDQPAASEAGQGVEHILSDMVQGMVSCCPAGATRVRGLRLSGAISAPSCASLLLLAKHPQKRQVPTSRSACCRCRSTSPSHCGGSW